MSNRHVWSKQELHDLGVIVTEFGWEAALTRAGVSRDALGSAYRRHGLELPEPNDPVRDRLRQREAAGDRRTLSTLADEVARLREVIAAREAIASEPLRPIRRHELKSGKREATAVICLSDVHAEETVLASDTPTGNEYNLQICDRSLGRFFAGAEWLISHYRDGFGFQIRSVVLWLGGDLINGQIHDEMIETSSLSPLDACRWMKPRLVAGIDRLAAAGLKVDVVCSYGNHGRDTPKSYRSRGASHSYEYALYCDLAGRYHDHPSVQFLANPAAHQYHKVYDFDLHFHHGDEISYGGGTGGITIPINKAVATWDEVRHAHYHHFGHFHQYHPGGRVLVNGSVVGYNGYAMSIKAKPEVPQQGFYLLDSRHGKTCSSPIWVR